MRHSAALSGGQNATLVRAPQGSLRGVQRAGGRRQLPLQRGNLHRHHTGFTDQCLENFHFMRLVGQEDDSQHMPSWWAHWVCQSPQLLPVTAALKTMRMMVLCKRRCEQVGLACLLNHEAGATPNPPAHPATARA